MTVLSLEQALSLPYATSRMVSAGWRVIRVEAPAGDPNRRIGHVLGGDEDRRSYFVGPNAGKESITLDLQQPSGREALHRLILALQVDVFCCNTLPGRYQKLGIDYLTLSRLRPSLIWAGISALGPDYPAAPGYDPALQASLGFMDLTGPADGPPTLCGLPLIDLRAGDELFTQVLAALWRRSEHGTGSQIELSMAQVAASWLVTVLPMIDSGAPAEELTRSGSEHRHFVPSNAYPTADGYLYLAVGSDRQWAALVSLASFASLAEPRFATNQGRKACRRELHERIADLTRKSSTRENLEQLRGAGLVCAPIQTVEQAVEEPWVKERLRRTIAPDGRVIRLPPDPVSRAGGQLAFPPRQGEHTLALLREAGFSEAELSRLQAEGCALGPKGAS